MLVPFEYTYAAQEPNDDVALASITFITGAAVMDLRQGTGKDEEEVDKTDETMQMPKDVEEVMEEESAEQTENLLAEAKVESGQETLEKVGEETMEGRELAIYGIYDGFRQGRGGIIVACSGEKWGHGGGSGLCRFFLVG